MEVYGCGHYGCVLPTADDRVVWKVTTDADEAGFVAAVLSRPQTAKEWHGLVRYHDVVKLPRRIRDRSIYVILRESAQDVGDAFTSYGLGWWYLKLFQISADMVRRAARRSKDPQEFMAATRREAALLQNLSMREVEDWKALRARSLRDLGGRPLRGPQSAAVALAACRLYGEGIELRHDVGDVGSALLRWMGRGILLCDVHPQNVGRAPREGAMGAVITDPGHALLLDDRHDNITVPTLDPGPGRVENPPGPRGHLLRSIFEAERARFARHYPHLVETELVVSRATCNAGQRTCATRDVAHAEWWGRGREKRRQRVVFVRRALALPRANLIAIVRHELGHLADPTPNAPGAEVRADRIAAEVGGEPIRYDSHDLQTVGPGRARRPAYLHA